MGYTTEFQGEFKFSRPLTAAEKRVLDNWHDERHGGNVREHPGMPSMYCQWEPNEDGTALRWDGDEKFYNYVDWLQYLIDHHLSPWGVLLNGEVAWRGEEFSDLGLITVVNNVISTRSR